MTSKACEAALQALESGEWDNPCLIAVGQLHILAAMRVQQVIEFYKELQ